MSDLVMYETMCMAQAVRNVWRIYTFALFDSVERFVQNQTHYRIQ
jgi:hypothetical protein